MTLTDEIVEELVVKSREVLTPRHIIGRMLGVVRDVSEADASF